MLTDYAVVDTETTGLYPHPGPDVITEIGWLVVRDGVPSEPHSALIRIGREVPEEVAQITGITTELLEPPAIIVPLADSVAMDDLAAVGDGTVVSHRVLQSRGVSGRRVGSTTAPRYCIMLVATPVSADTR